MELIDSQEQNYTDARSQWNLNWYSQQICYLVSNCQTKPAWIIAGHLTVSVGKNATPSVFVYKVTSCFFCQTLTCNFGVHNMGYILICHQKIYQQKVLWNVHPMTYFLWHVTHILLVKFMVKVRHKYEVALYIEMKGVFYFTMFLNNITFYCTHVLIGDVYITSLKVRLLLYCRS